MSGAEHVAVWVSAGGRWNLNCACGWKSKGVGYYQRQRALVEHDEHVSRDDSMRDADPAPNVPLGPVKDA